MNIHLASGIGTGPTKLAAFDAALNDAGVANFNLLRLSSVIPPKSNIIIEDNKVPSKAINGKWGDRLYLVMAEKRVDTPNAEAWAGIGWVQDPKTAQGLFVEHEGESKKAVSRDITQSLEALMATRKIDYGEIKMKLTGKICDNKPVCALVVAVYQSSDWQNKASMIS